MQDKAVLDRVNELYVSSQVRGDLERIQTLVELEGKLQRETEDRDLRAFADGARIRREVQALQDNLQVVAKSIDGQRSNTPDLERIRIALEELRAQLNRLQARIEIRNKESRAAQESELVRQQAELVREIASLRAQAVTDNERRAELELMEMLRAAVRSGTARPAQ